MEEKLIATARKCVTEGLPRNQSIVRIMAEGYTPAQANEALNFIASFDVKKKPEEIVKEVSEEQGKIGQSSSQTKKAAPTKPMFNEVKDEEPEEKKAEEKNKEKEAEPEKNPKKAEKQVISKETETIAPPEPKKINYFEDEDKKPKPKNNNLHIILPIAAVIILTIIVISIIWIGRPVCGNGKTERGETSETCCRDAGCVGEQSCIRNVCNEPVCGDCQYLKFHRCNDYECCTDDTCSDDEVCMNNMCKKLACDECQHIMNHSCIDYECCKNSDCSTPGSLCKANSCTEGGKIYSGDGTHFIEYDKNKLSIIESASGYSIYLKNLTRESSFAVSGAVFSIYDNDRNEIAKGVKIREGEEYTDPASGLKITLRKFDAEKNRIEIAVDSRKILCIKDGVCPQECSYMTDEDCAWDFLENNTPQQFYQDGQILRWDEFAYADGYWVYWSESPVVFDKNSASIKKKNAGTDNFIHTNKLCDNKICIEPGSYYMWVLAYDFSGKESRESKMLEVDVS